MNKGKNIYISTINAYCGGTVALAMLCATLRSIGYEAKLLLLPYFPNNDIKKWKYVIDYYKKISTYFFKCLIKKFLCDIFPNAYFVKHYKSDANILKIEGIKIQWNPFISKSNSIILYSEDVYGNPLECKNVVRWLLYYYDYLDIHGAYSKDDLFIAYRDVFNEVSLNPNNHIVTINFFNNKLYRQYNFEKREGKCYIIYKGKDRKDLPQEFDGPVFNSTMTQEDLVDMLNKCKYCYCYDPQTFYMKIAVVCGCIPILVMEQGKTENDYLCDQEHHYGIAYGDTPEQIEYAITTREICLQTLDYTKQNEMNGLHFIDILEDRFGKIAQL